MNLSTIRALIRDRVAEEGSEFWSDENLKDYVNLAQRFLAKITRGVPEEVSHVVGRGTSKFSVAPDTINAHQLSGYNADTGDSMGTLSVSDANLISPAWRKLRGHRPKWFILDVQNKEAHVSPIPFDTYEVTITVAVLPQDVDVDSDEVFNGEDSMRIYLNALVNTAIIYAYLKERYDDDAERMYAQVVRELGDLGVNPNAIPPFVEVSAGDGGDGR